MTRPKPQCLAGKLLTIRKRLGLSQSQLAKRLAPEMFYTRVSEFETGRRQPPLLVLLSYARVAGIHIDDLVDDNITELNLLQ